MIGGFHGFTYPAWFSLFSRWFYGDERTRANSWMQIGNAIGCSGMYLLAGHLCTFSTTIGWHMIFYVMAAIHIPWIVLWLWYGSDDPYANKRISDMELQFIEREQQQQNIMSIKPSTLSKVCSKTLIQFINVNDNFWIEKRNSHTMVKNSCFTGCMVIGHL